MREAVENLGCDSGYDWVAAKGHQMSLLAKLGVAEEVAKRLVNQRILKGKFGGGEWSRTTDAADMSHADSDSNLLDLLAEILLEATDGDNPR
jgi:hypothetical protein